MLALRFYIDKKIDPKTGHGGDHSRILDVAETDAAKARAIIDKHLTKNEQVNQVVSITVLHPDEYEWVT